MDEFLKRKFETAIAEITTELGSARKELLEKPEYRLRPIPIIPEIPTDVKLTKKALHNLQVEINEANQQKIKAEVENRQINHKINTVRVNVNNLLNKAVVRESLRLGVITPQNHKKCNRTGVLGFETAKEERIPVICNCVYTKTFKVLSKSNLPDENPDMINLPLGVFADKDGILAMS